MANWVISCHGYSDKGSGRLLALTTRQQYQNACIPKGLELVTFTEQGDSLSMVRGWALWNLLTAGREGDAYKVKHKSKVGPKAIINYWLCGPHDAADHADWTNAKGEYACGLFRVGSAQALEAFPVNMAPMTLQDAMNRAKADGAKRVYYLACQELA